MTTNPEVDDQLPEWLHEQLTSEPLPLLSGGLAQRVATRVTRRRHATVAAAAALVAIAVAVPALYVTSRSSTPALPSVTPTTSAAPSVAMTLPQACDYWRTAAAPVVAAYEAMRAVRTKQYVRAATWRSVRDTFGPYATAEQAFADKLQSPPRPWPTQITGSVPPTVSFAVSVATWADKVAGARTEAEFTKFYDQDPLDNPPIAYQEAGTAVSQACPKAASIAGDDTSG